MDKRVQIYYLYRMLQRFAPQCVFTTVEEMPHDEFESIEDINNYLLEHKEVTDFIKKE